VTYNVTRMQTEIEHRRVAINKVDMVPERVTMHRPVTVITQVPIGTSVAWIPAGSLVGGGSGTATALGPTPDPAFRDARRLDRAEEKGFRKGVRAGEVIEKEKEKDKFEREREKDEPGFGRGAQVIPQRRADESAPQQVSQLDHSASGAGGWTAHRQSESQDVQLGYRGVSVADTKQ
jgi:hypothetical protein